MPKSPKKINILPHPKTPEPETSEKKVIRSIELQQSTDFPPDEKEPQVVKNAVVTSRSATMPTKKILENSGRSPSMSEGFRRRSSGDQIDLPSNNQSDYSLSEYPTGKYFVICVAVLLLSGVIHYIYSIKPARSTFRKEIQGILSSYVLTDEAKSVIFNKMQAWSKGRQTDPLVIVIAGKEAEYKEFLNALYRTAIESRDLLFKGIISCNNSLDRSDLHQLFEDRLDTKNPSIIAFEDAENLVWDAPVPVHAFGDDDSSPTPKALILMGINYKVQDPRNCDSETQAHLLKQWTENGGHFDGITPIINSRIDYFICL